MTELAANDAGRRVPAHGISLGEATRVWLRVAALSFGGPAGQIAVMHRILVDEKRNSGGSSWMGRFDPCGRFESK